MQFEAKSRYVWYSQYKLRPIVNVIRSQSVEPALNWLAAYRNQRVKPIKKLIESAVANARDRANIEPSALVIKDIRVDQGPMQRYFKPGAMGRAMPQRRRMCHISIILETKENK